MTTTPSESGYAEEVCALTEQYLERVAEATAALPAALDAYDEDADAFEEATQTVADHESACDETLRDLRTAVGKSMPPNYSRFYLRIDDVSRLYAAIDEIPNRAERFVRELRAMRPALDDRTRETCREMALLVHEAASALADLTADYVARLVAPEAAPDDPTPGVTERVDELAVLESECDGLKYDALSAAFDAHSTADALVVRELVLTLDAAMDAVEDVGEQLLFLASGEVEV
ncbi:DUF47 domain-containing protein [Halorussus lipolyticus]|uniref:DUF47 domain-containing protein n=1 Tax=Halorussus lipolyticus TaxID=3034024 RepID=UPI0023E8A22A|nr:DUF47 family protein [Halorussus sp. DT80]